MKNKKWLYPGVIALSLAILFGYGFIDRIRTDSQAPEITISTGLLQVSAKDPDSALLQGVSAKDSVDGDVTDSLVVESIRLVDGSGKVSVCYAAFDAVGNVAKAQREVQYTDYQSPRFSLRSPLVYAQNSSFDVLDSIQATDMQEGDISHRIRTTPLDKVSVADLGTHDVEFRVTNSLGETVRLVLPVEIYPTGIYQARLNLTHYLIYVEQGASFNVTDYLREFIIDRDAISLKDGVPSDCSLKTSGTVDTSTPGVYSVAYRMTYGGEGHSVTGYSKLIVVVEG